MSQAELRGTLQCHPSPSPGTAGSELWGFCSEVALQPLPQARCSSAVTRTDPLPTVSHLRLPQRGLWRDLHPSGMSSVPSSRRERLLGRAASPARGALAPHFSRG